MTRRFQFGLIALVILAACSRSPTLWAFVAIGAVAALATWWTENLDILDAHLEVILAASSLISAGILIWLVVWWPRQV